VRSDQQQRVLLDQCGSTGQAAQKRRPAFSDLPDRFLP